MAQRQCEIFCGVDAKQLADELVQIVKDAHQTVSRIQAAFQAAAIPICGLSRTEGTSPVSQAGGRRMGQSASRDDAYGGDPFLPFQFGTDFQ
jgi:hypothetical protein